MVFLYKLSLFQTVYSSDLQDWSWELMYNIVLQWGYVSVWMCVRLVVVYTLRALWHHENSKWPCEPLLHFHSLSALRAQSQAKETHMVHCWRAMPVYDAELLLSLIYEDKPIHKIWNYSLSSLNSEWKRNSNWPWLHWSPASQEQGLVVPVSGGHFVMFLLAYC